MRDEVFTLSIINFACDGGLLETRLGKTPADGTRHRPIVVRMCFRFPTFATR